MGCVVLFSTRGHFWIMIKLQKSDIPWSSHYELSNSFIIGLSCDIRLQFAYYIRVPLNDHLDKGLTCTKPKNCGHWMQLRLSDLSEMEKVRINLDLPGKSKIIKLIVRNFGWLGFPYLKDVFWWSSPFFWNDRLGLPGFMFLMWLFDPNFLPGKI